MLGRRDRSQPGADSGPPPQLTRIRRRPLLAAAVLAVLAGSGGCTEVLDRRPDADGDGVPDGEDAAPHDDRVRAFVGGDPPPTVEFAFERDGETTAVTVTYVAGEEFDVENTDRLEATVDGDRVGTIPLPFRVGDAATLRGLPAEGTIRVLWFGTDGDGKVVGAAPIPGS